MILSRLALLLLCSSVLVGVAGAAPRTQATPFKFQAFGVRNPCFVDSVRFADTYLGNKKSEGSRWVRVLRWGTLEEDYSLGQGHAVAIFQWRGGLFVFDINHGVRRLDVPVAQREDLRGVSEAVYSMYPNIRPLGATMLDDSWPTRRPGLRGADDGPVNSGYRDAYRVAKTLSGRREVRLVRFHYWEKGRRRDSAAAVFLFSRQLCVYVPERGTMVLRQMIPNLDDDGLIHSRLALSLGPAAQVRIGSAVTTEGEGFSPVKKPTTKARSTTKPAVSTVSPASSGPRQ